MSNMRFNCFLVFNNLSEKIISINCKTENRSIKGDK